MLFEVVGPETLKHVATYQAEFTLEQMHEHLNEVPEKYEYPRILLRNPRLVSENFFDAWVGCPKEEWGKP